MTLLRAGRDLILGRSTTGDATSERRAVEFGWQLVDAYERIGLTNSKKVFAQELSSWYRYARDSIEDLKPWDAGRSDLTIYENDNNRLRFRRTLDLLCAGDRVFDVGFGRGYLCGLLLRDGDISGYRGIDIEPTFLTATQNMLVANELEDREVELKLGSLFDVSRRELVAAGTTVMICCEVLEHLPDPEAALAVLAEALPDGAELIFSVPLHGRLESVWGHVTVFDVARLRRMLRQAGLFAHHVEPVANTWTMVVASRDPGTCARVAGQNRRPVVDASKRLVSSYDFVTVDPTGMQSTEPELPVQASGSWVTGRTKAGSAADWQSGGLIFPVKGLNAIRLEIDLTDIAAVYSVAVRCLSSEGIVGQWRWSPTQRQIAARPTRRFALRPGESSAFFIADGFDAPEPIGSVQVLVEAASSDAGSFALRAAYLPD